MGGSGCLVWAWRRGVGVCVVLVLGSFVLFLASSSPSTSSVTLSSPSSGKGVYSSVVQPLRAFPQHLLDAISPRGPKRLDHGLSKARENKITSQQSKQEGHKATQKNHVKGLPPSDLREEPPRGFLVHSEVCSIPDFDPFHHTVTKYISRPSALDCKKTPALTSANGTTLVYHRELLIDTLKVYLRQHPDVVEADLHGHTNDSCCYRSIHRVSQSPFSYDGAADGRWRYSPKCTRIEYENPNERKPVSVEVEDEGLLVTCRVGDIVIYKNVHVFIQRHKLKEDRTNPEQYLNLLEDVITVSGNKSSGETLVDVSGGGGVVVLTVEGNSTTNYSNCDKIYNSTSARCRVVGPGSQCDTKDSVSNGSHCGSSFKGNHSSSGDVSSTTSHSSRTISDDKVEVRVSVGVGGEGGGEGGKRTQGGPKDSFQNETSNHITNHPKSGANRSSDSDVPFLPKLGNRKLLNILVEGKRTSSGPQEPNITTNSLVTSKASLGNANHSERFSERVSDGALIGRLSQERKELLPSAREKSANSVPVNVRVPEVSLKEDRRSSNEAERSQKSHNVTKPTQKSNNKNKTSHETKQTQDSNDQASKTKEPSTTPKATTTQESSNETKTTGGSDNDAKRAQGPNTKTDQTGNKNDTQAKEKETPRRENDHANHGGKGTKPKRKMKPKTPRAPGEFEPLSVIVFGTDSVSRLNLLRHMPMTHRYLTETLGAIDFGGFNKVADNTFPNMVATLSGFSEEELKNHSCMPKGENAEKFDECPFVWRQFEEEGYVTAYIEDAPWMGMFHYMHNGFVVPPTQYYGRPFFLASEKEIGTHRRGNANMCQGNQLSLQVVHDYSVSVARTFSDLPYFGLYWSASLTHDYINMAHHADGPHLHYLKELQALDVFNHTAMFFLSDHGMRFGDIRSTYVGMLEERLPYVFLVLPPWFKHRYPAAYANLHTNSRRLTSNFDLHVTLRDLLGVQYANTTYVSMRQDPSKTRGISLFQVIPEKRRCEDAGIPEHFCTCQETFEASVKDPTVVQAAEHIKHTLNSDLSTFTGCSQFTNYTILTARVSASNKDLLPKDKPSDLKSFVLQIRLSPGGGEVEATLRYNPRQKVFTLTSKISRINAYGSQSHCINDFELRKFCYCKDLLSGS
ncbi:uncharacterized protein LOC143035823 [Oratosquilla oratoria]|uniref:uncharacterized protein LOC143035823 n=1 Tax=Oratosquilla oratoria TaxID=337810 RepID=UPI003F764A8E